ncbi:MULTISPECIES: AzlD domain-containing protein [Kocuria]|uniref:AzlD domain-containing protein n=1 Tax=Kocuria TaxID=57493 RepID=UPI00069FFFB4|nr:MULTISPECIES: AzlD domain-containing protein [Kocuria]MCT1368143.1 AzlD domain-containing protein [Rothia sp. p3-SID1597]RUQ20658.1 AzlD domain-containing protein [Kocuria sp. HSID16901]
MNALPFLLAMSGLVIGTYLLRYLGVHLGSLAGSGSNPEVESQSPARIWMDRATVVLICAVAATTLVYEGQDFAGPSRVIGAGVGIGAALFKVPMLLCVILGMAVCAGLRLWGMA